MTIHLRHPHSFWSIFASPELALPRAGDAGCERFDWPRPPIRSACRKHARRQTVWIQASEQKAVLLSTAICSAPSVSSYGPGTLPPYPLPFNRKSERCAPFKKKGACPRKRFVVALARHFCRRPSARLSGARPASAHSYWASAASSTSGAPGVAWTAAAVPRGRSCACAWRRQRCRSEQKSVRVLYEANRI